MLILLNKYSNGGSSLQKWEKVRDELESNHIGHNYTLITRWEDFSERLPQEIENGERTLVAAGGDGTVNFLLNQVMRMKESDRRQLILGAIGLGSSNDFHKPFSKDKYLTGNIPYKLNCRAAVPHNVGRVDFEDEKGLWQGKYFMLNASIGVIAQANHLFNSKEKVVRSLKSKWVMSAIWYAALKTLFAAKNIPAEIKIDDERYITEVTNLSILIHPHVSGDFCYDFEVSPQSNNLGVALCEKMGIFSRVKTISSLAQAKFTGLPKTRIWKTGRIEIYLEIPTPLELDGEVYLARCIKITLLRGVLRVCQ